jgi:type IV secretion system protein VirB6
MIAMFIATLAGAPTLGDLSNFVFYTAIRDFLLGDDGLITQWTAGLADRLGLLLGVTVLPLITFWILLAGYRIVTGQSREPMMALVMNATRASLIVVIATGAGMGNPWIAGKIHDLNQVISEVVTGSTGMGNQIQESLGWTQVALSSIDALPTGDNAALDKAKDRSLIFTGIGTAGVGIVGGIMLMTFEITLRFLVAIGPLAMLCLLFKATAPMFRRWLESCITTLFALAVTSVMITISLKMVCAVAASFWADKLIGATVLTLSNGAVDLHMAEGITSMAMQQGALGLIMTMLIVTVTAKTSSLFGNMLGSFNHYSFFGAPGGASAQPGPQGQPVGAYQQQTVRRSQANEQRGSSSQIEGNNPALGSRVPTTSNVDVIKKGKKQS